FQPRRQIIHQGYTRGCSKRTEDSSCDITAVGSRLTGTAGTNRRRVVVPIGHGNQLAVDKALVPAYRKDSLLTIAVQVYHLRAIPRAAMAHVLTISDIHLGMVRTAAVPFVVHVHDVARLQNTQV